MNKYLFLGGIADGQWKETEGQYKIQLLDHKPGPLNFGPVDLGFLYKTVWYRMMYFATGQRIYVLEGLSEKDVIDNLIKHYYRSRE